MNRKIITILIAIVCFSLCLFTGCSSEAPEEDNSAAEEKLVLFDNELINEFFVNYQELSNTEFHDFSSNKDYDCSAGNSGYWFGVSDYSDTTGIVEVRIQETNETADAGVPAMREVFFYSVKALDNTIPDEDIYRVFDERGDVMSEQTLSSLKIVITPDMELSGGHNRGHIEIEKTIDK